MTQTIPLSRKTKAGVFEMKIEVFVSLMATELRPFVSLDTRNSPKPLTERGSVSSFHCRRVSFLFSARGGSSDWKTSRSKRCSAFSITKAEWTTKDKTKGISRLFDLGARNKPSVLLSERR